MSFSSNISILSAGVTTLIYEVRMIDLVELRTLCARQMLYQLNYNHNKMILKSFFFY